MASNSYPVTQLGPNVFLPANTPVGRRVVAANKALGAPTPSDPPADAAAPAPADPNAPGPHFVMGATSGDPAPPNYRDTLGEQRLAPGVHRFNDPMVPGVYAARGADGALSFSNHVGPDGQPVFAGAIDPHGVTAKGLRNRMVASDAGAGPGGWNSGADPVTGAPIAQSMQRDTPAHAAMLASMMNGGGNQIGGTTVGADPRANFTYAQNSLHMTPAQTSALLNESQADPAAALHLQQQLNDAMKKDPNNADPDVAAANALFADQLAGHTQEARQRFYGSGNGVYGAMGAGGGGGRSGSGLNMGTLLNYNTKMAGLRARAQHYANDEALGAQRNRMTQQQIERQNAKDFQTQYYALAQKDPSQAALFLKQNEPQPDRNGNYDLSSPKAQAWRAALFDNAHTGARAGTYIADPSDWSAIRHIGQNVTPENLAVDPKTGRFAGFYGDTTFNGTRDIRYPAHGPFGGANFDESLWDSMSPALLRRLQQQGLHRAQPVAADDAP